jgi:hypothetical protein
MENGKISPIAIILTLLFHFGLFYLANTDFPHHHGKISPYDIIRVSIPVSTEFHPHEDQRPDITDLIQPPASLITPEDKETQLEKDRYYLPQELSQQVHVLQDDTTRLNIPIRLPVNMTLYINESGSVDDITIDKKGDLTEEEEDQLIQGFKKIIFLPGMRGEKVVKSIYRIQLQINRKMVIHR